MNCIDYVSADVGPERGIHEQETRDMVVNLLGSHGFELIKESKGHRKVILMRQIGLPETLNRKKGEVAIIVISHRLSTVRDADTVIYLSQDSLPVHGTFESVRSEVSDFDNQAKLMGL